MDAMGERLDRAKTPRRNGAKVQAREEVQGSNKHLRLSARATKTLGVYAVMTSQTETAVVEWLISTYLKRYVVSDRGGTAPDESPANLPDEGRDTDATLMIGETLTPSEPENPGVIPGQGRGGRRRSA